MGKMDVDGEKLDLRDLGEEGFEEGGFGDGFPVVLSAKSLAANFMKRFL